MELPLIEVVDFPSEMSLKNLKGAICICDEINIYDNTEIFKEIIDFKDGNLIWKDKNMPNWTNDLLKK